MLTRLVPRLDVKKTALFVCDMQEKFSKTNKFFTEVTQTAKRVMRQRTFWTFRLSLRNTIRKFSMCIPEVVQSLEGKESVVLVGLEAHVCILHTTYSLIERGIDVNVVVDAVTARTLVDRKYGFKQLEQVGAVLTTSECVILRLVKDAAHPNFKEIQKIITPGILDSSLMDMSLRILTECG
nr:Isochorismatase domain containing protein [Haemonchus contortus]